MKWRDNHNRLGFIVSVGSKEEVTTTAGGTHMFYTFAGKNRWEKQQSKLAEKRAYNRGVPEVAEVSEASYCANMYLCPRYPAKKDECYSPNWRKALSEEKLAKMYAV